MIRLSGVLLGAFFATALSAEPMKLTVAGSVSATGNIQTNREVPFFDRLASHLGGDVVVDYAPIDRLGMDPEEALDLVQSGIIDIASLGVAVVSRRDPLFLGLDLVGMATDYDTARDVVDAYGPVLSNHLRESYNAHLLGIWPFGPQVLFCRPEISDLAGIAGQRVRVYDANLGAVIEGLGGTAVQIKFGDVKQALELGLVDCAITGPSSANTAGWVAQSRSTLPLGFQIAFNMYAINLETWNALSSKQQLDLTTAFATYVDDVWVYSRHLYEDALRCNVGVKPCETVSLQDLQDIPVTGVDRDLIRQSLATVSLPSWLEQCAVFHTDCETLWKESVGQSLGLNSLW